MAPSASLFSQPSCCLPVLSLQACFAGSIFSTRAQPPFLYMHPLPRALHSCMALHTINTLSTPKFISPARAGTSTLNPRLICPAACPSTLPERLSPASQTTPHVPPRLPPTPGLPHPSENNSSLPVAQAKILGPPLTALLSTAERPRRTYPESSHSHHHHHPHLGPNHCHCVLVKVSFPVSLLCPFASHPTAIFSHHSWSEPSRT